MRVIVLTLAVSFLISCSLSPGTEQSARRAHTGKYIVDRSHWTGSRSLFVSPAGKQCLNSSRAVSEYLNQHNRTRNRDAAFVLYLNDKNHVLEMREIGVGYLAKPSQFIPIVTQEAGENNAASVILVQCLPTRDSKPYKRDLEISNGLQTILTTMDVDFLDHLIMGRNECFSFADNQLL